MVLSVPVAAVGRAAFFFSFSLRDRLLIVPFFPPLVGIAEVDGTWIP